MCLNLLSILYETIIDLEKGMVIYFILNSQKTLIKITDLRC